MKKIFLFLMSAVLAFGLASCGDDRDDYREPLYPGGGGGGGNNQSDLDYEFVADQFWGGYYGDVFQNGTATYRIQLTNGTLSDEGFLTTKGSTAISLLFTGDLPKEGQTLTLPVGSYSTKNATKNKIYNEEINGDYYSYVEIWETNGSESYVDYIKNGTLTVTNNGNNNFKLVADLDMYYLKDNQQVADGNVKCTYTGKLNLDNLNLDYEFDADEVYGMYLGTNTGLTGSKEGADYLINISNAKMDDDGYATKEGGTVITLLFTGELPKNKQSITVPVGTYSTDKTGIGSITNTVANGSDGLFSNTTVEIWETGAKESYFNFVNNGTLTITDRGKGKYDVDADLDMYYIDTNNNEVADGNVKGHYSGALEFEDYSSIFSGDEGDDNSDVYEVYDKDVNLGNMSVGFGNYYVFTKSQLGNYFFALYQAPIDRKKDIFTGEGFVLTVDLFTDYQERPDLNQLNATFNYTPFGEYEEWKFQGGHVTVNGEDQAWEGTYLDEITELEDEDGKYFGYGRAAMVTDGAIVAKSDGKKVDLQFNLTTEAGKKITGSYSGDLEIGFDEEKGLIDGVKARHAQLKREAMIKPFSKYALKARRHAASSRKAAAMKRIKKSAKPAENLRTRGLRSLKAVPHVGLIQR